MLSLIVCSSFSKAHEKCTFSFVPNYQLCENGSVCNIYNTCELRKFLSSVSAIAPKGISYLRAGSHGPCSKSDSPIDLGHFRSYDNVTRLLNSIKSTRVTAQWR